MEELVGCVLTVAGGDEDELSGERRRRFSKEAFARSSGPQMVAIDPKAARASHEIDDEAERYTAYLLDTYRGGGDLV